MAFVDKEHKGWTYNPGYFLAYDDEGVTRETRQIPAAGANVITAPDGTKYAPMGSAYPANDATAVGILYEDVDVTVGDMPGSVVTGGAVVYEDRLAPTAVSYSAASPAGTENPAHEGWFDKNGDVYTRTRDRAVITGKTYYTQTVTRLASAAKTALEALGFKFITGVPEVVRPDWEV